MWLFSRISLKDKVIFYESVANLLEWGVTLLEAIKWFGSRLPKGAFKEAIENTVFFIESGDRMNVAMRKIPNFYNTKEIAIIESGEQTGMLQETFQAIADEMRMQQDLKRKIIGSLTYPFIIFMLLILAISVIMIYVIPSIIPMIAEMATEVPFATQSLIATSDFLRNYIFWILLILIAAILLFRGYTLTRIWAIWWDRLKIFNPISGKLYTNYIIVQVMSTFYLLVSSGVSIVKALQLTGASAGNVYVDALYAMIAKDIAAGNKLSDSMQEHDKEGQIFKPDILQMIESAEQTSTIHNVSIKIAEQYRRKLDSSLDVMVKFIEPIALIGAGVFVAWFALAIISVMIQITQNAWLQ